MHFDGETNAICVIIAGDADWMWLRRPGVFAVWLYLAVGRYFWNFSLAEGNQVFLIMSRFVNGMLTKSVSYVMQIIQGKLAETFNWYDSLNRKASFCFNRGRCGVPWCVNELVIHFLRLEFQIAWKKFSLKVK